MSLLEITYEVLFSVLFGAAALALWRRPSLLALDIVLFFGTLAGIFAIQLLRDLMPGAPEALSAVGLAVLLAQPGMALRLTRYVYRMPPWVPPAMVLGYLASLGGVLVLGTDEPLPVAMAVGYFLVGDGLAATILAREALRRSGFARWRLLAAATAMALLALAILVAAAGPQATAAIRGLVVVVGLAFLLAFMPPRWLRRLGQQGAAHRFLTDLGAAVPGTGTAHVRRRLVDTARELTGALDAEVRLAGDAAVPAPLAGESAEGIPPVTVVRFAYGSQRGELRLAASSTALFAEDDLELLELLGVQTLAAVERETILGERTALAERLTASNAELVRASDAKSDFLAAMSHELRTPLNAIIGFSELILDPPAGDAVTLAETHDFSGHIHRAGLHLLDLINDILDLSRVEAGRLDLHLDATDVAVLLAETVAAVRPLAEAKQLALLATPSPSMSAEVDASRFRQIVYNLLSNAIKFTPRGGRVEVTLVQGADEFRLSATDTGPGIPLADQERIFAPFEQLARQADSREGTGLGLALTRYLVQAHGGRIELESAPGAGSRFTVVLPLRRRPADVPAAVEPGEGSGPLMLIIEDDVAAAELLRRQLGQAGYRTASAGDGESGLAAARRLAPAAVLLDILLPGLDGWEVLRRLRADPVTASIPVMVISVVESPALGLALGAVDYFVKPVARETLLAALDRLTLTTKVRQRPVAVLVIDADPDAQKRYRDALVPEGFSVLEAASGESGLALAGREETDLIVLDILLPDLDGFEVIARLKAHPVTAEAPILVVTGRELTAEEKGRLNEHVLGVLAKGDEALAGLRTWLDRASRTAVQ